MSRHQVRIGPEFFSKAKLDYADWRWALVREFFQNSIDAAAHVIKLDTSYDGSATTVSVDDDGIGMNAATLADKLLSLGSSGKDFANSAVGGFGKAKELLYFGWSSYKIETHNLVVEGVGADYTLTEGPRRVGTRSTIVIPGDWAAALEGQAQTFVRLSNIKVRFEINGRTVEDRLRSGYYRRDLGFGRAYTNRQAANLVVVRIGGMPMFTTYSRYDGCVVVELTGNSASVLTSNRDSLQYTYRTELEGFIGDLTVNKRKALRQPVTEYIRYSGERMRAGFTKRATTTGHTMVNEPEQADVDVDVFKDVDVDSADTPLTLDTLVNGGQYVSRDKVTEERVTKAHRLASEFIIKNELGRTVKPEYRPDSDKFSQYAYRLVTIWAKLLTLMHDIYEWPDEFSVGFIFTENDTLAQFEQSPEYGKVYYINPVIVSGSKWNTRYQYSYRRARATLHQLAITALHELVHGMGYHDHDEDYSSKLTEMAGKLLAYHKELLDCYSVNDKNRRSKKKGVRHGKAKNVDDGLAAL